MKKNTTVWKTGLLIVFLTIAYFLSKFSPSLPAQLADNVVRPLLGNKNAIILEAWYFGFGDKVRQIQYKVEKPNSNIFTPDVLSAPQSGQVSNVTQNTFNISSIPILQTSNPLPGEGIWKIIPEAQFPNQAVMAKTFLRTDPTRSYSIVSLVKINMQKLAIGVEAGTYYPGETRTLFGPGIVPQNIQQADTLLAVFNGGFQKKDGHYGMIVANKIYVPLRKDLATLLITSSGSARFITYEGEKLDPNIVGVRQNGAFLIKDSIITSFVENGTDTWGRTTTNSMYTWRSAIGITKNGNLIYAVGNSLIPETLAKALLDAGAVNAMQLDINPYWVRFILYNPLNNGGYTYYPLLKNMHNGGYEYLHGYNKDFFYVYKKG